MNLNGDTTESPEPDVEDGLRILCFDGGGVRGKASLLMLKAIMDNIGPGAKPCDFFDVIAGTSTGALIAIMLARLGFTIDESIEKYDELGGQIFSRVAPEEEWIRSGNFLINERPAETAFKEIGRVDGEDEYMDGDGSNDCKCLVTTLLQDYPESPVPIRSYPSDDDADPVTSSGKRWKIWEAARAATAVPVYFRPFAIAEMEFVDAGIGYNNPSVEVFYEITTKIPEYNDRRIACFVSIGTGVSTKLRRAPGSSDGIEPRATVLNPGPAQDRGHRLVKYVTHIAADTTRVHREMERSHMPNGRYFRFDPGNTVGSIDFHDASMIPRIPLLVREHVQRNPEIKIKMRNCAEMLKNASPTAFDALRPPPVIVTPLISGNWLSIPELLGLPLRDPDTLQTFLVIFSLSRNLDCVLDVLESQYNQGALTVNPDNQIISLILVTKFVLYLWLTGRHIAKVESFLPQSEQPTTPVLAYLQADLKKALENNAAVLGDSISSLDGNANMGIFAEELAEALAVLEDKVRREDPVGECVRWFARGCERDFSAFPERVETWVLQSVLLDATPETRKQRYMLFYKVAKRSKDLQNFSAVRAITSALQALHRLRTQMKIEPTDLERMRNLDHSSLTQQAEHNSKPYLTSLDVLLPRPTIDVSKVADSRQHIDWAQCGNLFQELEKSHIRLTSPQKYMFCRDRVVGFVKRCLINVKLVEDIERKIDDAQEQYKSIQAKPATLFQPRRS